MATLKVFLENGYFSDTNGVYVTEVTPSHVIGNGWDCSIREDGSILCEAIRNYSDGVHSMRYVIARNGFAKLTLKIEGQPIKTLRKGFVLSRGSKLTDGTIGLSGGYVDGRYAFFRDADFCRFLDKFGITAIKNEDPNRIFRVRNARYGGGECHSSLISDGVITEIGYDSGRTEGWRDSNHGTCAYEGETSYSITGAKWAIHSQNQDEGDCHNHSRILYTQVKNVLELENSLMDNDELAQYALKRVQARQLKELDGKKVSSFDDIKKVIDSIVQIAPKMVVEDVNKEKAEEFFRSFDHLEDTEFFYISVWGPMPCNPRTEYEISVRCGDGCSHHLRVLHIAELPR